MLVNNQCFKITCSLKYVKEVCSETGKLPITASGSDEPPIYSTHVSSQRTTHKPNWNHATYLEGTRKGSSFQDSSICAVRVLLRLLKHSHVQPLICPKVVFCVITSLSAVGVQEKNHETQKACKIGFKNGTETLNIPKSH